MKDQVGEGPAPAPLRSGWLASEREAIVRIARRHGATRVRVFGSVARGEDRADSDIDLLLTLEPGTSLLDLIAIKQDVEDLLARPVDVVTDAALSEYIRGDVLREAVDI